MIKIISSPDLLSNEFYPAFNSNDYPIQPNSSVNSSESANPFF